MTASPSRTERTLFRLGGSLPCLAAAAAWLALAPPSPAAPAPSPAIAAKSAPARAAAAPSGGACQTGRAQYASGDVLKAIASLERCVDKEPRNREGWAALAMARLEAGRFPESADAFGKAHAIRPGDASFLASYLQALEGAGRAAAQIPVLRDLADSRRGSADIRPAEKLLALIDSLGSSQYPEDRIFALEHLGQAPDATLQHREMLAAAYLERGMRDKSQAEYRGLLSRRPENGEYWAGLAASVAEEDREAALECYRKAIFFSNQAGLRAAYEKEAAALKAAAQPKVAAREEPASKPSKTGAPAAKVPEAAPAQAVKAPQPAASAPKTAAVPPASKPFNLKAFQDSVYKAELEKRMAALRKPATGTTTPGSAPAPSATVSSSAATVSAASDRDKAEAEKAARAREEAQAKANKEEQERQAKADKEEKERLAKEAARKAEEERKLKEKLAKEAREKQEKLAREEKERQDKLAKEAERKIKEERDRVVKDSLVKAEKERLAKVEAERKAKEEEEKARKQKEERDRFVKDSVDKVEKERLAKVEAEKKALEARDRFVKDSLAKVEKERLAKEAADRKIREARDRFVKDSLVKVEKDRLAKEAADRKARDERDRFVKDSLAKVEKERLVKLEAERKAKEARDLFVKDSVAKVEKERLAQIEAERKVREARERFVKDSLARVEKERLAKLEAERKAREEQERKERLAREKQERHDRAISLYRSGQLDSSEALFKAVLAETPSPDAYYYAGRTHLDKGRPDKALELLLKAPKDKPDMDGLLGRAYLRTGKKAEALEALERHYAKTRDAATLEDICVLRKPAPDQGPWAACLEKLSEHRPSVGKYHEELAVYFRKTGDKAKSLERYAKLLALEPGHGEANYQLGMDWGSQGVHDRAVPPLEKAVAAFPARGEAWKTLAKGQAALFRKEQAWESYRKAATLLPKDADVARGRLALAKDPGREAELPGAFQAMLKLAPEDADANLGYARLRFQAKDYASAERHFRTGTRDSKDASAWGQFGRSLLELKKFDEASAALQKAVELGETSPALRYDLARLHLDKGDADKAEALVKALSAKSPSDPEPYYWQGRIAQKRQQAAVEEEFYRKAHQLKPDEPRYAEATARLLYHRDEYKQAIAALGPLEARLSADGKMLLADCLAASGEGKRALDIYSSLFQKEPSAALLSRRIDALVRMGRAGEAVDAARGTAFGNKPEVQFSIAKAHLSLAESHVLKGDLDLAVSLLKDALDADSHRPEYHFHLGMAYYRKAKLGKAVDAYTDAMRYRVDYPEAVYWKGVGLVETGHPVEARNFFGELSQHADPRWKARGLLGLARVFESEGKWEAVEHHLVRSVAAFPNPEAMAYLSRVNLKLGRFPEAEDWAKKALALDAHHEEGTLALAEALAARKHFPEALGLAEAALRMKPLSCGLLVQTAKLNFEAGRVDSTLLTTGKAIQVCPQEPLPHFYAGMASRVANRPDEAKRHFKSFKKLGGDKKMLPD